MSTEERVFEVLERREELQREGLEVDLASLCQGDASLLDAVQRRIELLERFHTLLHPADPAEARVPNLPGYERWEKLGQGGWGVVYRAWQRRLNRPVAVKLMLAGMYATEEQIARFQVEAEAIARLRHPNIVQIHEFSEHGRQPYVVLEYAPGGSLKERLKGIPQSPKACAHLVAALARGVQHAHQHGIVHRDLKPANVLLREPADAPLHTCTPLVSDFGLARQLDTATGYTQSTDVLGTASYMAPEQASGQSRDAGPAADVYALGAILYELVTGRPPHQGQNREDTLEQVRTQEPVPPRRLQPRVPRDLETICLKCLEKEPARRYASAAALADDVDRFLNGEPILARPTPPWLRAWRWARKRPTQVALLLASVLLVASAVFFARWQESRRTAHNLEMRRRADLAAQALQAYNLGIFYRDAVSPSGAQSRSKRYFGPLTSATEAPLRAKKHFQEAIALLEELTEVEPEHRRLLGLSLLNLGDVHEALNEPDPAEQCYRRAHVLFQALANEAPRTASARQELAAVTSVLNTWYRDRKEMSKAQPFLIEGVALCEELIRDFPENLEYRNDLAGTLVELAAYYRLTKQTDKLVPTYERATGVLEEIVARAPTNGVYRSNLGQTRFNLAKAVSENPAPEAQLRGVALYTEALQQLKEARRLAPTLDKVPLLLRNVFWNRASILGRLERYDEALADWDLAVALSTDDKRDEVRLNRALTVTWLGEHERGVAEAASAVPPDAGNAWQWSTLAKVYAQAISAAGRDAYLSTEKARELADAYAEKAMAALWKAHEAGHFQDANAIADLKKHPRYKPLRARTDFARLLEAIAKEPRGSRP